MRQRSTCNPGAVTSGPAALRWRTPPCWRGDDSFTWVRSHEPPRRRRDTARIEISRDRIRRLTVEHPARGFANDGGLQLVGDLLDKAPLATDHLVLAGKTVWQLAVRTTTDLPRRVQSRRSREFRPTTLGRGIDTGREHVVGTKSGRASCHCTRRPVPRRRRPLSAGRNHSSPKSLPCPLQRRGSRRRHWGRTCPVAVATSAAWLFNHAAAGR